MLVQLSSEEEGLPETAVKAKKKETVHDSSCNQQPFFNINFSRSPCQIGNNYFSVLKHLLDRTDNEEKTPEFSAYSSLKKIKIIIVVVVVVIIIIIIIIIMS